ncbi:MAG: hypothetical protein V1933_00285, partial [Candidatus Omnitrophota bacterium]
CNINFILFERGHWPSRELWICLPVGSPRGPLRRWQIEASEAEGRQGLKQNFSTHPPQADSLEE